MNKDILSQYLDACALADETEADLVRLKLEHGETKDSVKGSNPNYPYEPRIIKIEGISYSAYKTDKDVRKIEKLLKERQENAKKLRLDVEAWMNTIPPRMQRIVRMKYFQGLTWDSISKRLGFISPNASLMEFKRFMAQENGEK